MFIVYDMRSIIMDTAWLSELKWWGLVSHKHNHGRWWGATKAPTETGQQWVKPAQVEDHAEWGRAAIELCYLWAQRTSAYQQQTEHTWIHDGKTVRSWDGMASTDNTVVTSLTSRERGQRVSKQVGKKNGDQSMRQLVSTGHNQNW